jgi:23S rRNA (uracil1939-C5)-methyltransferase
MRRETKKLPVIEKVEIIDIAQEGKGIAKVEELVIFVEKVVPGDVVDVQISKKKKNLAEAYPVFFHKESAARAKPFCIHFGTCGGCKWQHMQYEQQLHFKQKTVQDALTRLCKINLPEIQPILASEHQSYYRNKLEFTFSNSRWLSNEEVKSDADFDRNALGFHVPKRFDKIIDISHCHLQDTRSNDIRNAIRAYALANGLSFFDIKQQTGLLRNLIMRNSNKGDWMLVMVFAENNETAIADMMAWLGNEFPFVSSLQYIINEKKNDTIFDQEVILYKGQAYITEEMTNAKGEKIKYRVSAKSFYQTNAHQAEKLYHIAATMAGLTGTERVYDLYTGTGTIANFIASSAKEVIGIEYIEDAIADAKANAELNKIQNTRFFAGDMKDLLSAEFAIENGKPDVIITDPPRAGMHEDVCKQLLALAADRIVYVSCNPATQARDLGILDALYEVVAVQPVDMFPHTEHVENVVLLKLR